MRTLSQSIFIVCLLLTGLSSTNIMANTYTATQSGDWTNSKTWGGSAPSNILTTDQVIIPTGISVKIATNLSISGTLASLDVEGTLTDSSDTLKVYTLGTLSGAGIIKFGVMNFSSAAGILFTGNLKAETLINKRDLNSAAAFTISKMIVLDSGIFKLQTGTLVLDSNATIYINGGTFTASTASVNLKSVYNVYYGKASYLSGVELMGLGLNDVTVNVTSGNTVKLLSNLTTNGTLYLMSGTLVLNSNNLTLNGYFMSSDSLGGDIHSTAGSVINVFTKGSTTGGSIHFAANGNTVSKMNINSANSADYIALFSDLKVIDTLTLANGKIKMMGGNVLEIASTGRIAGGGVSSYIVTSASSYLRLNLSANDSNAKQYIIGTIANYAPAYIKLNSGSPDGTVDIGVDKGVFTNGASGDNLTTYQSTVNATWFLNSNITNNLSLNLSVNWSSDMELNNFDRSKSFISHYSNYHWDTFATSSASVYSNGTFASVRTNITSLSPFTVFDQSTNTGIANANNNVDVTIFPNPASDNMNVNIADMNLTGNSFHMEILDLTGRIINESILEAGNNSININSLINGNYIMKIYDAKTVTVRKFNKI